MSLGKLAGNLLWSVLAGKGVIKAGQKTVRGGLDF